MSLSNRTTRKIVYAFIPLPALLLFFLLSLAPGIALGNGLFPSYPVIRTNVAFWEKIYSTYSVNSAVIHDRDDLSKVYEVVQLLDKNQLAADRINKAVVKLTIEKYQTILSELAKGKSPSSASEYKVASQFKGLHARRQMALAAESVRSQIGQRENFYAGVIRSGGYIDEIRRIFRAHGLPEELAYLPHVESSFNTEAYSKAGASGIFQFTLGTGKQYMQINDVIDERSDPFIAADAAARYLKNSYQKLGNWPLALTSYNYGTAGMMRAQEAKGSYEKIFSEYREGHFGFASRNFYSEFLAAVHVARKWEQSSRLNRDRPVQFTVYPLPGYIHIDKIRRHFHISDTTLKMLNPALRPSVYKGNKLLPQGYRLRLPAQKNIHRLITSLPRSYFSSGQTQEQLYRVKAGDSLGRIAYRHGISLSALLAANGLKRDAKIVTGQRLRIPSRSANSPSTTKAPYLASADSKSLSASHNKNSSGTTSKQQLPRILSAEQNKIQRSSPK